MKLDPAYLEEIRRRRKESKVYKEFQLTGLMIAEILGDRGHKSLFIKLAKTGDAQKLLALAKDVSTREGVKNKGAYFMRAWASESAKGKIASPKPKRKKKQDVY